MVWVLNWGIVASAPCPIIRMREPQYLSRCQQLQARFEELGLDALLVTAPPNVQYLTGFTGSSGAALITGSEAILFTDPRYAIQASDQSGGKVRIVRGSLMAGVAVNLRRRRLRRVGFDPGRMTHAAFLAFREGLPPAMELAPASGLVEQLRMIKSAAEIEAIRSSVRLASKAFDKAIRRAKPGVREMELAAEIDYRMRRLGAERPSFDTIVASGPRSALPHAAPTSKPLAANELLLIDMGAQQAGYASDMTRMAFLGSPGEKTKQLYAAVQEAQQAAVDSIRPGRTTGTVDKAARDILKQHQLDALFVHATGHGVGLEIHEPPRIGRGARQPLAAGMVITVEPGVYMNGFGGIRIEDTVVVTENGCEVLTPTSKELLEI